MHHSRFTLPSKSLRLSFLSAALLMLVESGTAAVTSFQTTTFTSWDTEMHYQPSDDGDTLAVSLTSNGPLTWSALPSQTVGFFNTANAGFVAMPTDGSFTFNPALLGSISRITMTAHAQLLHSTWNFVDYAGRVPWFFVEHSGTMFAYRFYGGNNNWGNDFNFETGVFTHEIDFVGGGFDGREINLVQEITNGSGTRITTDYDLNDPLNSPDFTGALRFGVGWANSTGGALEEGPSFGSITRYSVSIEYNAVPEPAGFLLMLAGGFAAVLPRRRRTNENPCAPRLRNRPISCLLQFRF